MRHLFAFLAIVFLTASPAAAALQAGDVAILPMPDSHQVRFTLRTTGGYVGFVAGDDWSVLGLQSRMPVTVAGFQIPDAADNGTPDSTNLAINLILPGSDDGKKALAHDAETDRDAAVTHYKTWTLYTRDAMQGATRYTIIDAIAPTVDVVCGVRIAWPHLAGHDAGYDAKMEALLKAFLDSFSGGTGDYDGHLGEIVRSPE